MTLQPHVHASSLLSNALDDLLFYLQHQPPNRSAVTAERCMTHSFTLLPNGVTQAKSQHLCFEKSHASAMIDTAAIASSLAADSDTTKCELQHPQLQEIPVFLWGGTAGRITLSPRTQTVVISRQTYVRAERVTLLPRCISSQDPAGAQHCYQTIKIFCNFSSPSTDTGCKICLVMFIGATNRTI